MLYLIYKNYENKIKIEQITDYDVRPNTFYIKQFNSAYITVFKKENLNKFLNGIAKFYIITDNEPSQDLIKDFKKQIITIYNDEINKWTRYIDSIKTKIDELEKE